VSFGRRAVVAVANFRSWMSLRKRFLTIAKLLYRSRNRKALVKSLHEFDEQFYLSYYDDAAADVREGRVESGWDHYVQFGHREWRATHRDKFALLYRKIGAGIEATGLSRSEWLAWRLKPLPVEIDPARPAAANVFVGTLDPELMFAGYIAFFHFLCRLAEAGTRLRFIVTEDAQSHLGWFLDNISDRPRWIAAFKDSEVVNATDRSRRIDMSADDAVIAFSCWTAHDCWPAARRTKLGKFLFFVQEYEPAFHQHDAMHFLASEAYDLPHLPIFNSKALHAYFKKHGIGVFRATDEDQFCFEHAMPVGRARQAPGTFRRRLLFYARPEGHAARNLFEIGVLALRECMRAGIITPDWEIVGIGAAKTYHLAIDKGLTMKIIPRMPQAQYEDFIQAFDVGLSLMSAPHPGIVHFEWATAGIPTVVNMTPERDAAYFRHFSPNIMPAEPSIQGIVTAIGAAVAMARNRQSGPRPTGHPFPTSWDDAFSPALMGALIAKAGIPVASPASHSRDAPAVRLERSQNPLSNR
jgi:hypothetical protein